jgi:glycerophosphoryl diester phosphodiesterase
VHLTLDGVVVVAHDFDLTRICELPEAGGSAQTAQALPRQYIGEFNFEELPYMRKKFTTGLFGDAVYEHANDRQRLCSLEELFQLCNSNDPEYQHCNDAIVNIDLKKEPTALKERLGLTDQEVLDIYQQKIQKVYDLIVQYKM